MKSSHHFRNKYLAATALLFLIVFSGEVRSQPNGSIDISTIVHHDTMRIYIDSLQDAVKNCDCQLPSEQLPPYCQEICLEINVTPTSTNDTSPLGESKQAALNELVSAVIMLEKAYRVKALFDYNRSIKTKGYNLLKLDYNLLKTTLSNLNMRYEKALYKLTSK